MVDQLSTQLSVLEPDIYNREGVIADRSQTCPDVRHGRDASATAELEPQVVVVADLDSLRSLQMPWDELVDAADIDHPFLYHTWLCTWWECFGSQNELYVLLVKRGENLVAAMPLMRTTLSLYGQRVRCLQSFYNWHTPRSDIIVARGHEASYAILWHHLQTQVHDWDVLMLPQVPSGSAGLAAFQSMAQHSKYLTGIWHGEESPYVPIQGTWEAYTKQLSSHHRATRRRLRNLRRLGSTEVEVVTQSEELERALRDGFRIEAAAWKRQVGTAIVSDREVENFYRLLARRFAQQDKLRLQFLNACGQRIAFAYVLEFRNKLFVLKSGYDPDYAAYSPGNVLCHLILQDCFQRRVQEYDFLGANDAWKRVWSRHTRRHEWLFIFAPRARLRWLYRAKFQWIPALRRWPIYRRLRDTVLRGRHAALRRRPSADR